MRDGCDRLLITDLNEGTLNETKLQAEKLRTGVRVEAVLGDIAVEEFARGLASKAASIFGRLDYAVNAAGIPGTPGATGDLEFENYRKVQQINSDGLYLCQQGELKIMMGQKPVDGLIAFN